MKLRLSVPGAWITEAAKCITQSVTPCHEAQEVGPYQVSNPLCLTVMAVKSEDYTTAPQQPQHCIQHEVSSAMMCYYMHQFDTKSTKKITPFQNSIRARSIKLNFK